MPFIVLLLIALVIFFASIRIVNTGYVCIVERLGRYHKTLQPGWNLIIPLVDVVRAKVSAKQQILEIEPQSVITKDNVKISIDNVVFYQVVTAKDAIYNIESYKIGVYQSSSINMRNVVGSLNLDEVLSGRDMINNTILTNVENISKKYGVEILSVEIKNIIPPVDISTVMEKQMTAEREKRATILQAEGQKQSAIAKAEGQKQSQLLEAEGRAKAMETVAQAQARAIILVNRAIIDSNTNEVVIALKQVEALIEMSKNPANKLIIPTEALSSLGSIASIAEMLSLQKK